MTIRPSTAFRFALAALVFAFPAAHAQTPPDAGALQRETERSLQAPRPAERPLAAPAARPMDEDAKAARIAVKRLVIDGANLVPVAELEALLADLPGQSLTLAELERAAQRIAEHYRARGWFVRVYLPAQDVTDGTVRIQVLEGRYEGSRLEDAGGRADGEFVRNVVTRRLKEGEPLSAADLERGLLLANDLPGIAAAGLLEAGETPGGTRLALRTEDTPFVTGDVGVDNHGIRSTGRGQVVGGVALNNLAGIGDRLGLRALAAEDVYSARLGYSLPLGSDGWRLGTHFSTLNYELGGRYRALDAEGRARTAGLDLSWAWVRQSDRNLSLGTAYEWRRYEDDVLSAPLRRHRVHAFTLALSGDQRDSFHGGGITWGGVQITLGRLDIRDPAADRAADAVGPRADGDYSKLGVQLNRLQALGISGWRVQAMLSGQWADGNLGSSEKFTLGGPHRVRAYPVNEASGDAGVLMKLELQRELGHGWQAMAFYDIGRIRQHRDTWTGWQGGSRQPNIYSLSGAGLGVSWNRASWQLAASAAVPVDGNPGKDANGRNNDGTRPSSASFWLALGRVL